MARAISSRASSQISSSHFQPKVWLERHEPCSSKFFSSKFRASSLLTIFKISKYYHISNPAHLLSSFEHTQTNLEVKLLNKSSNSQIFWKKWSNIYYFLARLLGSSHFEPKIFEPSRVRAKIFRAISSSSKLRAIKFRAGSSKARASIGSDTPLA